MAAIPLILSIDTSGPFVAADLSHFPAARIFEDMPRGQAERLGPLCEDLLKHCGKTWSDLDAIAVGVGPGNFTGIRIGVSFARGVALARKIPSIGVTAFEVFKHGMTHPSPLLLSLPAPQGRAYVQPFRGDTPLADPMMITPGESRAEMDHEGLTVCGFAAEQIAAPLSGAVVDPPHDGNPDARAAIIGAIATRKLAARAQIERAKPLYVKPPDAAPSREPAPVILP